MDRRRFIASMVGGSLVLKLSSAAAAPSPDETSGDIGGDIGGETGGLTQTFLRIDPDDTVTVFAKHLDMGQGIWSGLASIVAEELDASWAQMRVEGAPTAAAYKHTVFGVQTTGGSTSIANSWDQLRAAGATARAMLVAAAAARWAVDPASVAVDGGVVSSGLRKARFGSLTVDAARQTPPVKPILKAPDQYRILGKTWKRMDVAAKTDGQTRFGMDLQLPDMQVAMIAWPPRFGAKVRRFDATKAKAVPGVTQVVQTPQGVAVIAHDTWSAWQGRDALLVDWDVSAAETRSSEQMTADFIEALGIQNVEARGLMVKATGDVDSRLKEASSTLTADYVFPYLAHAQMEPLAVVCQADGEGCRLWGGFQSQTGNQKAAAKILGLPIEKVKLDTLYAGGSFGRRATFDSDWIVAVVEVVKASGLKTPVKLVYTREDDMRAGYYRPLSVHRLTAGLDKDGDILAVDQTLASQSLLFGGPFGDPALTKADPTAYGGGFYERYDAPASRMRWVSLRTGVSVHTFRGVSFNTTTFAKEVFMEELALAAKVDSLEYRLRHLKGSARQAAVLKLAAGKAGWGRPPTKTRALGLSVQECDSTFVAQVADVSLIDGRIRVHKVTCAVDCGLALNPDNVKAQMEGGIGFAVGYALTGEITLRNGAVQQSNFHDYPPLRMEDMPDVEVHILNSGAKPTGVGEPGSNPTAAAIANALLHITGRPVRQLPLSGWLKGLKAA